MHVWVLLYPYILFKIYQAICVTIFCEYPVKAKSIAKYGALKNYCIKNDEFSSLQNHLTEHLCLNRTRIGPDLSVGFLSFYNFHQPLFPFSRCVLKDIWSIHCLKVLCQVPRLQFWIFFSETRSDRKKNKFRFVCCTLENKGASNVLLRFEFFPLY